MTKDKESKKNKSAEADNNSQASATDNEERQARELLEQAGRAAQAAQQPDSTGRAGRHHRKNDSQTPRGHSPLPDEVPAAPYHEKYGQVDINQGGLNTGARIGDDGRVQINIQQQSKTLSTLLVPTLRKQLEIQKKGADPYIPPGLGDIDGRKPPPMNLVIQIVGSRGDVQPFVALGKVLKEEYGHRVRIATHGTFREFVNENGLEFFEIGGDPSELMAFMVKNPGLMPGFDSLKAGDVGKRRKGIYEILVGCWRSCIEAGDGTGIHASDDLLDGHKANFDSPMPLPDPTLRPFVADAIIANPPSFAGLHIAEKLGLPLHFMFTMPWSPTQMFPHPLATIIASNTDANMANLLSYGLVDLLTWQGLGDVINRFRERSLGLEPLSILFAPGVTHRLRIPYTYCWSPALIPKPADWGTNIDISGFFFLDLATDYEPPQDLADFLDAGPPPVYIGFGSIVVDDPNAMTKMIFEAVKKTGQRALVSKGWGGLGADKMGIPEGVFMLGNCPHDWLFDKVSCVVHHGGAGTTAAGIAHGCPTVVVPFFGDQPFWGAMTARAGAGPTPIPYKHLDADKLADQINDALKPESKERAKELAIKISKEKGSESGAESFHAHLGTADLRCSIFPERIAVWRVRKTDLRLSALAATVLGRAGLLDFQELELFRAREYDVDQGSPTGPITGGAAALVGTLGSISMGVADMPVEILKSLHIVSHEDSKSGSSTPKKNESKSRTQSDAASPSGKGKGARLDVKKADEELAKLKNNGNGSGSGSGDESVALEPVTTGGTAQSQVPTVTDTDTVNDKAQKSDSLLSGSHHTKKHLTHTGTVKQLRDVTRTREDQYDVALGGAKAMGRIASAGLRAPMEFTLGLAKGFHNAPKMYHDDTVREQHRVTGFHSGLKAAGKEFGYGFYDGITGLVTQPIAGARKDGVSGFFKGTAKGFGGLILKPGAGIWGLPGWTAKGVYAELTKYFGSSVQNYIIASRTTQGFEEWGNSTPAERAMIIDAWSDIDIEKLRKAKKKQKRQYEKDQLKPFRNSPTPASQSAASTPAGTRTPAEDSGTDEAPQRDVQFEKKMLKQAKRLAHHSLRKEDTNHRKSSAASAGGFGHNLSHRESFPSREHPLTYGVQPGHLKSEFDYDDIIHRTIASTSRGDQEEDAVIEQALRLCLPEFERVRKEENITDDEMFRRAVQSSLEKVKQARLDDHRSGSTRGSIDEDHQKDLELALTRSLTNFTAKREAQAAECGTLKRQESDSLSDTSDDEDYKLAISQSQREHDERQANLQAPNSHVSGRSANTVVHQGAGATNSNIVPTITHTDDETDVDFQRALKESEESAKANHNHSHNDDNDAEYQRALKESQRDHEEKTAELHRQKTEEDVVMEYMKKQSMLEHKFGEERRKSEVTGS